MGLKEEVKTSFDNTKIQKFFTLGFFLIMTLPFRTLLSKKEDKGSLWFGTFLFCGCPKIPFQ